MDPKVLGVMSTRIPAARTLESSMNSLFHPLLANRNKVKKKNKKLKQLNRNYNSCIKQLPQINPIPSLEISLLGLLISGGDGAPTSVEIFVPSTDQSCSLISLPNGR